MKKNKILALCGVVLALSACDQKGFQVGTGSEQKQSVENSAGIDRNKTISKVDTKQVVIDKPMLPFIYSTLKEYSKGRSRIFNSSQCFRYIGNNINYLDKKEAQEILRIFNSDEYNAKSFRDGYNGFIKEYLDAFNNKDIEKLFELNIRAYSEKDKAKFIKEKAKHLKETEDELQSNKEYLEWQFNDDAKNAKINCILLWLDDFTKPSMNTLWDGWMNDQKNAKDAHYFFTNTFVYGVALTELVSYISDELSAHPNKTEKEYRDMIIESLGRKDALDLFTNTFEDYANRTLKFNVDFTGKSRSYMVNNEALVSQDGRGTNIQMNGVTWLGDGNTVKGKNYMLKTVKAEEENLQKQKGLTEKGNLQGGTGNSSKVEN